MSERLQAAAGLVALVAIAAVGLLAFAMTPDPAGRRAADQVAGPDTAVVEAGRGLYVANCASCHGPGGAGGPDGPSLMGAGAASADFYLRTGRMPLSAPGQPARPGEPAFTPDEIAALVAYVASLGDGPAIPQVAEGGELHRGWELYTANCAACHAVTGAGNAIGGGFVAVGLSGADATTIAEAVTIGPGAMPRFTFDDAELADLAAYIRWLTEAESPGGAPIGGTGPVAEGFIGVAIGLPLLVLAALFVARTTGHPVDRRRRPDDADPVEHVDHLGRPMDVPG